MAREDFTKILGNITSNKQEETIQKVVPITPSKKEKEKNVIKEKEVQFSFFMEKELLKKMKLKALEEETSIKQLLIKAIKNYL